MATYTATFTIDASDNGNLSSYNMFTNNSYSISNGMNNGSLTDDMDSMQFGLQSFYGGTVSYVFSGGSTWLDTTTVTWTIENPTFVPYFIYVTTENFYYPMQFEAATTASTICNTCQLIQLTQCGDDSFYLDLGLADGSYTAYYTDNTSGVVWEQGTYSSSESGGLAMYQWSATEGMFNPYSFYTLTLVDSDGDPVSWVVNDVEYTCATLTFKVTVNVTD